MINVFIYALTDPATHAIRYIGKANDIDERYYKHLWEARQGKTHKRNWIQSLLAEGRRPVLELLATVPANDWGWWEKEFIAWGRAMGYPLTNGTDGGENPPSRLGKKQTSSTCEKRNAKLRGQKRSPATCARMSTSHIGNSSTKGRKLTPEHRQKISIALRGHSVASDTRLKIAATLRRGKA